MSNLIITVISIALVAVTAVTGIWYGSAAYNNYVAQARANMLIEQSREIYGAATMYATQRGETNFKGFSTQNLVNNSYLQNKPPIITMTALNGYNGSSSNFTFGIGTDLEPIDGYYGPIERWSCTGIANNRNMVTHRFRINDPYNGTWNSINGDWASAAEINHPIVKMCLALNAKVGIPAGLTLAPSGLPYAPSDSAEVNCNGSGSTTQFRQPGASGISTYNYCMLNATSGSTGELYYLYTN